MLQTYFIVVFCTLILMNNIWGTHLGIYNKLVQNDGNVKIEKENKKAAKPTAIKGLIYIWVTKIESGIT